jgi:cytochrome c553
MDEMLTRAGAGLAQKGRALLVGGVIAAMVGLPMALAQTPATPAAASVDPKVVAYGKHLARECSGCHRIDGVDNGIPSIVAQPVDEFTTNMKFYQTGDRNNPAMVSVAQSLDEQQIAALAAYYSSLPKPAPQPKKK